MIWLATVGDPIRELAADSEASASEAVDFNWRLVRHFMSSLTVGLDKDRYQLTRHRSS